MEKAFFTIFLLSLIVVISCNKYDVNGRLIKDYDELEKTNWLLGEWEKKDSLGTLKEIWNTLDDSTFAGQSYYIINEKDTVHYETVELIQDGDHLIYNATVKGQNNDEHVPFQKTIDEDSLVVFENPKHDFPQKISYKLVNPSEINISISGKESGKLSSQQYRLKKVK